MKVDIYELERRALLVRDSRTQFELAQWNATHASDAERWRYQQLHIAANYIAANSPLVTLALIRRIRELETTLYHAIDSRNSADPLDGWFAERDLALHVLEKGVVLP